jgi:hypothetical protein
MASRQRARVARGHGEMHPASPALLRNVHRAGSIRWRTHGMGAAQHGQTDALSRRGIQSLHPPARSQVQPTHLTLVLSLPPGKRRKPTPGRREITFLHARGGRGFLLERRPPERRGRRLLSRGARQATAAGAERCHPRRGRKAELMAGHSFRSGAGGRARAVGPALLRSLLQGAIGSPSIQCVATAVPRRGVSVVPTAGYSVGCRRPAGRGSAFWWLAGPVPLNVWASASTFDQRLMMSRSTSMETSMNISLSLSLSLSIIWI